MIADICVAAAVAVFMAVGYRAGFMRSLIKVAAYIVSVIASFLLYPVLSEYLMTTKLFDMLAETVNKNYVAKGVSDGAEAMLGGLSKYFGAGLSAAADGISRSVAGLLVNIIAFIVILIASRLILHIAERLFGAVARLPVIRHFNRIGGAALGGVVGIIVLYAAFAAAVLFVPLKNGDRITAEIEESTFASEMYKNNVLLNIMEKKGMGGLNGKG